MYSRSKINIRHGYMPWLYLGLLALLLYAVLPQVSAFKRSLPLAEHAHGGWLLAATVVSLGAHVSSGFKYASLALKPLRLWPTILVQLAGLLTNRLLPAGIGGLGINYLYLHKARHTQVQAGVVVTMNNLIGFVGHLLLVAALVLAVPSGRGGLAVSATLIWAAAAILVLALGALLVFRRRLKKPMAELHVSLHQYRQHPSKVLQALIWSAVIAACYALCLWYCALALGLQLTFLQALIVLTLGVAAGTVSPTPGGLVGVEAALVGGLVLYDVPTAQALAAALLFRLITYWFALLLGAVAFIFCRKARYI